MAEFALALPILVFGLMGGADLARAFAIQLAVQNGARAGAEAIALGALAAATSTEATAHVQQEMNRTPGMDATKATITLTFTLADGATRCTGAASTSVPGTPSVATPCYANVRVRYSFKTITPWPIVPNSFTFDRTTRMRRYS